MPSPTSNRSAAVVEESDEAVEFVLLEHGFMGSHQDLSHLNQRIHKAVDKQKSYRLQREKKKKHSVLNEELKVGRRVVVLNHSGNDRRAGLSGLESCAARLTQFVLSEVTSTIGKLRSEEELEVVDEGTSNPASRYRHTKPDSNMSFDLETGPGNLHKGESETDLSEIFSSSSTTSCTPRAAWKPKQDGGALNTSISSVRPFSSPTLAPSMTSLPSPPKKNTFLLSAGELLPSHLLRDEERVVKMVRKKKVTKLVFHIVGYSMGGLVLRAALPQLVEEIERQYGSKPEYEVAWRTFISLCAPHTGVSQHHPTKATSYCLASILNFFCLLPQTLQDLLLKNSYLEKVLSSPTHLDAVRRFEKKVFIALTNDRMVWNYSSAFFLSPVERRIIDGWKPADPTFNPKAIHAIASPSRSRILDEELPKSGVLKDASNPLFNTRTPEISIPRQDMSSPRPVPTPWLVYGEEEAKALEENREFLARLHIVPAVSLEELKRNGVCMQQSSSPSSSGVPERENWINEESWPKGYLPRERQMAVRFLQRVGPVRLHVVDLDRTLQLHVDDVVSQYEPGSYTSNDKISSVLKATFKKSHQLTLYPGWDEKQRQKEARRDKRKADNNSSVSTDSPAIKQGGEPQRMNPFGFIVDFIVYLIVWDQEAPRREDRRSMTDSPQRLLPCPLPTQGARDTFTSQIPSAPVSEARTSRSANTSRCVGAARKESVVSFSSPPSSRVN